MSLFEPRREILPPTQQELWTELLPTAELGFVLYGGTAIALRLGHRASEQPSESLRAMTYFEGGDLHLVADDVRKTLIGAASAVRELPNIQLLSRSLSVP